MFCKKQPKNDGAKEGSKFLSHYVRDIDQIEASERSKAALGNSMWLNNAAGKLSAQQSAFQNELHNTGLTLLKGYSPSDFTR